MYEFIDATNINPALICIICQEPLKDPQVTSCDHVFCRSCITQWMRQSSRSCPTCRLSLTSLQPANRPLRRMLDEIEVKCTKCGQQGLKREDFDNHIKKMCPKGDVTCLAVDIMCPWTGPRKRLNRHLAHCKFQRMRPILEELMVKSEQLKEELQQAKEQNQRLKNNARQTQGESA